MKTTVDIADAVLNEARKLADREGVTVKVVVEQGLRNVITQKNGQDLFVCGAPASRVMGSGRNYEAPPGSVAWLAYEGRGG